MKYTIATILLFMTFLSFSQEKNLALEKSNDMVYDANELVLEDFVSAEKEYRKAISKAPSNTIGSYNLGNALYEAGHLDEAMSRHLETIKNTSSKEEKHKAYHNIGNVLMKQKLCKEAVEIYKNALRNNPKDDESRYNLALAKECAKQQGDGEGEDENEDKKEDEEKKDENKENENEKDEGDKEKDDQDNEGEDKEDKKDGDEKEDDKGKPKDEKDNKENNKPGDKKKKQQQPQPGQLSPQQVKNLLEAMNNHEKKVQDKINAKKTKGAKVRTEKDW